MNSDQIKVEVNGRRVSLTQLLAMDLPAVTDFRVYNCPGLTALPDLPAVTVFRVHNCPGLTALPDMPAVTDFWADNCPGLTALPDLPAVTDFRVYNCPGLVIVRVGADSRSYEFAGIKVRSAWFVKAGCRFFSLEAARRHWGPGGDSDRPDCLALVEKIATAAAHLDAAKSEAA